jgi:acyl-CoA reductase-like NAD-dependent aldehyde dehydrogenase
LIRRLRVIDHAYRSIRANDWNNFSGDSTLKSTISVDLPWGGSGESGFGREHGESAIENFTEPKSVWLALEQ